MTSTPETRTTAPGLPPAKNMVWVPGGEFLMGSEDFYPEERPVRRVAVEEPANGISRDGVKMRTR